MDRPHKILAFYILLCVLVLIVSCGRRQLENIPASEQEEEEVLEEPARMSCQCEDGSTLFVPAPDYGNSIFGPPVTGTAVEEEPRDESMDVRRGLEKREWEAPPEGVYGPM